MTHNPLVSQENPHGYWCRKCGRSREYAEKWCSLAYCAERRRAEDNEKENPRPDYMPYRLNLFEEPR